MKKEYLVCVDSDGCAMDTMRIKHTRCFGPCLVREWQLQEWEQDILDRWNQINLYSITRGVNRFRGLLIMLGEIHEKYRKIEGLSAYKEWVEQSDELSNDSLRKAVPSDCTERALRWSESVNAAIRQLPPLHPFSLVESALRYMHHHADIVIVSGANREAVIAEWESHGLMEYVDAVMTQDSGSKSACIAKMLDSGYVSARTLMCGDAPGDELAARKNGVCFYPIMVGREEESWRDLMDFGFSKFLSGDYTDYGRNKTRLFYQNLGAEGEVIW